MNGFLSISATIMMTLAVVTLGKWRVLESIESSPQPAPHPIRWEKRHITIALSSSLNTPGPNFKLGSEVIGAVRRALARWESATDITFLETLSNSQSISDHQADGMSLITIADTPENNAVFSSAEMTGRTRVFYDPQTGVITEADISINPHPALSNGSPVQFSTDGTPGTYDLETTFMHEIGHLLGLDHSSVMASTMHARQALNGLFGLPAFSGRTLTEEDRERARSLYGLTDRDGGTREGTVSATLAGKEVWAEHAVTGRVVGASAVSENGQYRIDGLLPGQYRIRFDQLGQFLKPRFLGINGDLSSVALPLEAGKSFKIFLGGEGLEDVLETAISINSPYFKVVPGSLKREQFASSFPVISFGLRVAANAPFGDYSIRLQSNSGEVAYLAGAITIDPGVYANTVNPLDDPGFFVSQQYRDVLGREPDATGLAYWTSELEQCGSDNSCLRSQRLAIANAFFAESEFQRTGLFVYGLYKTLDRFPTFEEFNNDRRLMLDTGGAIDRKCQTLALEFVARREFMEKYPAEVNGEEFVNLLLTETLEKSRVDLSSERSTLLGLSGGDDAARAAVLTRLVTNPAFVRAEYNRTVVLMQYFAYLRRDADEAGYKFWVNALQNKPTHERDAFRTVACAFINSVEYQSRFGVPAVRKSESNSECGR